MSLPDDILVPRKSPYGLFARKLEFFHSEVLHHTSRTAELRQIVESSKVYKIIVERDHGNKRDAFCAPWLEYTKEALAAAEAPPVVEDETKPESTAPVAIAISPEALVPGGSKPSEPAKAEAGSDQVPKPNTYKLVRYNPDDYIAMSYETLVLAILFQQFEWDKLPKQHRDLGDRQVPGETLEDGLGVQLDPSPKGPERHITLQRLQRAMRQEWILSPGEHRARHEQLLVRIGSPFDVNVLSSRGSIGRKKHPVPITNIMLAQNAPKELSALNIYEDVSLRWAADIVFQVHEQVLEIKKETSDDVL